MTVAWTLRSAQSSAIHPTSSRGPSARFWKIALGCLWLAHRNEALDPAWDHLRRAVLGAPLRGYLLQAPFAAMVTRRLDVNVRPAAAADPWAMRFALGGVALAVPLGDRARVSRDVAIGAGWE